MRLTLLVGGLMVAATAAIVVVISLRVNAFAKENAIAYAMETARANGAQVKNALENALDQAATLSRVFEAASVVENRRHLPPAGELDPAVLHRAQPRHLRRVRGLRAQRL